MAAPVLSVIGLDNFELPRPMGLVLPSGNRAERASPNGGTAPDGFSYIGNDFRKAYLPGIPTSWNGGGQAVGLFELDGYYPSDITKYETVAGLPNVPLTNVLLDSFSGSPGGNNLEVALDIEMAISMAPGLSEVIVYEGTQPNDVLNQMAIDNRAKQLSSSWTWSGYPNIPPMDQIFQEFATQGQSFFNASGDGGTYTGVIPNPADDPNITIVGGTTLTTDTSQNYLSEKVWSWFPGQADASSGGISQTNAIPTWQQGISVAANLGSTVMRNIPDVALTADEIYVYANNGVGYSDVGGTSAATPLWAGFTALVNQQAVAAGRGTAGFLNPVLYAIGKGGAYSRLFHDITVGNNTNASSPILFPAAPGYDLCTGWGTPAGTNLINTLALGATLVVPAGAVLAGETCLPTNGAIDPGETVTVNFSLVNAGAVSTTNLVATLVANSGVTSPSGPRTYGVLSAGGGAVGQPFTFTANGSCGGTITATLQLQDGATSLGTVNFILPLGVAALAPNFAQNFDGVTAPALPSGWSTTHSSSRISGWVTSTAHSDTAPNAAYGSEGSRSGVSELLSPGIPIAAAGGQLTFRQYYNMESGYDGGVLEIAIGSGSSYMDILSAGGSFVTNGYNAVLSSSYGNPLGGRAAWSGNSGGFVATTVQLPVAAAGQTVYFKWRLGTDSSTSGGGWYVDTVSVSNITYSCCSGSADVGVSEAASANPAVTGQNLTYSVAITNLGPSAAAGVTFTDALPAGVTFVSASPGLGNLGGTVTGAIGTLAAGAGTNLAITVAPTVAGAITNVVSVGASTFDAVPGNNTASLVTTVDARPVITAEPTNRVVVAGAIATFSVTATGTPGPVYQWYKNTTNPVGGNASALNLTNVQPSDAGAYMVLVTNLVGATSSVPATLTVEVPPVISVQPSNQVVLVGTNVSFSVTATGAPAPGYQWLWNGTNPVATGTNLFILTNVQPGEMGNYTVLVTNAAGSTNSAPAHLTVLVPPSLSGLKVTATNVGVSFQSVMGLNYTLEYKNQVTDANWTAILPATAGTGGVLTLYDTNAMPAVRFYRVICD